MSDSHLDISETIQPLEDDDVAWALTDNTTFVIEGVLLPVLSTLGVIGSSSSQSSFIANVNKTRLIQRLVLFGAFPQYNKKQLEQEL